MDAEYNKAVNEISILGDWKNSRVGGRTRSLTGVTMRFDLSKGFPLPRHKAVPYRVVCTELAWFLSGRTNIKWLKERNVHIWDDDAAKVRERGLEHQEDELGPIYGYQWRHAHGIDQIQRLIDGIHRSPTSRRHLVTAWNPADVDHMGLPPCHHTFQVLINDANQMDLVLSMRSGDMGLGVPFNIASYGTLLLLLAKECGCTGRHLVITVADAHIYESHLEPLNKRLSEKKWYSHDPNPIEIDLGDIRGIADFVAAHEADPNFKLTVRNYDKPPALPLELFT